MRLRLFRILTNQRLVAVFLFFAQLGIIFSAVGVPGAQAAADTCFCGSVLSQVTPKDDLASLDRVCLQNTQGNGAGYSFPSCNVAEEYIKGAFPKLLYPHCDGIFYEKAVCDQKVVEWDKDKVKLQTSSKNLDEATTGLFGSIPTCLLRNEFSPQCRDISVFIVLFINWARGSFAILGSFALAYFIYGGLNLIISAGNPEKVKKGTDAMLSAVLGMFIAFAGYLLIKFLGNAVGVKNEFNLL